MQSYTKAQHFRNLIFLKIDFIIIKLSLKGNSENNLFFIRNSLFLKLRLLAKVGGLKN